ncbi:MAG: alpha/beta fold hydrolase [Steroidobacteraceae bacterium]
MNIRLPRSTLLLFAALVWGVPANADALRVGWQTVDGIDLFYREGGARDAPAVVVFLHGNPASSLQYAQVMHGLAQTGRYHVLAMDYPSFGFSAAPDRRSFRYTFDNVAATVRKFLAARNIERYALFMQDYGVPIGFRLIAESPDSITAIIVQNGVIHLDGFPRAQDENGELRRYWRERNPQTDARRRSYTQSMTFPQRAGWDYSATTTPEVTLANIAAAQRPGVVDARNDLWFDYGSNLQRYSEWQAALRKMSVPVLVLWGSRDDFFTTPGALAYLRDAPHAEVHILDADHYATLDVPGEIIHITRRFLDAGINPAAAAERPRK